MSWLHWHLWSDLTYQVMSIRVLYVWPFLWLVKTNLTLNEAEAGRVRWYSKWVKDISTNVSFWHEDLWVKSILPCRRRMRRFLECHDEFFKLKPFSFCNLSLFPAISPLLRLNWRGKPRGSVLTKLSDQDELNRSIFVCTIWCESFLLFLRRKMTRWLLWVAKGQILPADQNYSRARNLAVTFDVDLFCP